MQGYPYQPWPQPLSFSQNGFLPDVGSGEAQGHAYPTQYNPQMYSSRPYEGQVGADAGGNGAYKWIQPRYVPATEGKGSAGTIPALQPGSMNRATDNNHEYFHPNVALTGSQMLLYSPRYTNPQVSRAGAPIVAPHPGTANVGSYNPYIVQDVAGVSAYGGLTAPVDSRGASLLEVSEGTGSGYVFNLNEFSASSAAAGEHTRQQQFPGYTHGVEYVEQSGMGVMLGSARKHGLAPLQQQQYGQATRLAGLPVSSGTKDYFLPFHGGQSYPSVKLGPGTHAGLDALSPSGPHHHWWPEDPLYPQLDATSVTWTPSYSQFIPATAVNATDNSMAGVPAGSAGVTAPNPSEYDIPRRPTDGNGTRMSTTRTLRKGPRRGVQGQMFEESLEKVQERLREEGAEVGAVECLGSEIFVDGKITKAALKAKMTKEQRKAHRGTQKYMLLLDVVEYPQGSNEERNHRCLLCPPEARAAYKNREDSVRHIYKDHFGLSFDCEYCTRTFWHNREVNKHVKAVHEAKGKGKDKGKGKGNP